MSLLRFTTWGGPERNGRRGQDRGYTQEGKGRRADRVDREGGRRVGADGQEARRDEGPVARAPEAARARERGPRAIRGDGRLPARRRLREPAQAAPHGDEGLREASRRGGLHGQPPRRAALRQAPPRGDGPRARPQGRRGVPDAETAARRGPGRLRRGGLRGPRRGRQGQVPDGRLPALRRRARPGLLGRDGRVRLPRAPQRLRVRRRRAREGGPRQRRRGRRARRRGGEDIRALPPLRGSLRARPRLRQPLPGQREGQRREQGRPPQEEPVRPRPVVPRRPRVQPQAARGPPRPERGQAPLQARHARARAVRRGQGGALAAAAGGVLVREVGDREARQAGDGHGRRVAPLLGRPRLRAPRGRRRPRRLRRRGLRLRDRGGRRRPRARVGRGPGRQLGPGAAAEAPVHGARRAGGTRA